MTSARSTPVRPKSGLGWLKWLLLALLLGAMAIVFMGWQSLSRPMTIPAGGQVLHIESGETFNTLINDLGRKQMLTDPFWTRMYVRFVAKGSLKSGYYDLKPGTTPRQLIEQLSSGKMAQMNRVQLIEGNRFSQFWPRLQKNDKIEHTIDADSPTEVARLAGIPEDHIEGWLAPDTYYFGRG